METRYEHITLNEDRVPGIAGTTMKVVELVVEQQAYGWSPEELYFQHPYLTLGQIHSALAYYWDHSEELDRDIQRRLERGAELRRTAPPSLLVARLRRRKAVTPLRLYMDHHVPRAVQTTERLILRCNEFLESFFEAQAACLAEACHDTPRV